MGDSWWSEASSEGALGEGMEAFSYCMSERRILHGISVKQTCF